MPHIPHPRLAALLVSLTLAGAARAEPLTYAAALATADRSAPNVQASALKVDAARAASRAAGRLPDPKLSVGIEGFPVSGPHAGRFGADDFTMAKVGVIQDVPNAARRRAEVSGATAEIGVAEAEAGLEQRRARVATALAWIDLAYAERRLAALDQLVGGLKDVWAGQPASIASGASRPAAGLEPRRLQAVFADERSKLAAAVAKSRAELARWTGDPAPTTAGEAPHYEIDAAALHAALDRHPVLLTAEAAERGDRRRRHRLQRARRGDRAAKAAGFVQRVYGRAPGDVIGLGAPLADVLVPEWAGAQGEFLAVRHTGDAASPKRRANGCSCSACRRP